MDQRIEGHRSAGLTHRPDPDGLKRGHYVVQNDAAARGVSISGKVDALGEHSGRSRQRLQLLMEHEPCSLVTLSEPFTGGILPLGVRPFKGIVTVSGYQGVPRSAESGAVENASPELSLPRARS